MSERMIFTTISGSKYEIRDGMVRRVNPGHTKRADGEWVRLINTPIVEIGEPVLLTMASLSEYGADDYGTLPEDSSPYTTRVTSLVSSIEGGRMKCRLGYTTDEVEAILGPDADLDVFSEWMYGQTMAICEGRRYDHETGKYEEACGGVAHGVVVYRWDLARFLEGRPVSD